MMARKNIALLMTPMTHRKSPSLKSTQTMTRLLKIPPMKQMMSKPQTKREWSNHYYDISNRNVDRENALSSDLSRQFILVATVFLAFSTSLIQHSVTSRVSAASLIFSWIILTLSLVAGLVQMLIEKAHSRYVRTEQRLYNRWWLTISNGRVSFNKKPESKK